MNAEQKADDGQWQPDQDALNRMYRAYQRGTGCHLTAEMIHALSTTLFGQMWAEADPRALRENQP